MGGVSFDIAAGARPTFEWRPACRVNSLVVRRAEMPNEHVWGVSSLGGANTNTLEPPIHYGQVPGGAGGGPDEPPDLVAGSTYRVTLYAWFNTDVATDPVALDSTDFTP